MRYVPFEQLASYGAFQQSGVLLIHISRLPPLESLEAVLVANKEGSFLKAAEELGITHGAVSRRVAAIEAWAGYRVFDRHGRGVRVTAAGYALLQQIERAVALLDDSRRINGSTRSVETIRVGVVPSFARMWLFPNLARLEGEPPDLRIEPDVDNRFMTLSEARIAIRLGTGDWPGVISKPLFQEWSVPVASRAIAAELGHNDDPARLLAWPLLHDASAADWIGWLGRSGVFYEPREQDRIFSAYDLTLHAASQGLGIALLREPYGNDLARSLDLVPLSSQRVALPKQFYVLTSAVAPTAGVTRLVGRLLDVMRAP